jgi:hypothetical protein
MSEIIGFYSNSGYLKVGSEGYWRRGMKSAKDFEACCDMWIKLVYNISFSKSKKRSELASPSINI